MLMHNPSHPGAIVKEYIDGLKESGVNISATSLADSIHVTRTTVSRIINEKQSITADIAILLEEALGVRAGLLLDLQAAYDLWQAKNKPHKPVTQRFYEAQVATL